jgi:hypoxanthine phosphoribosyltransferase
METYFQTLQMSKSKALRVQDDAGLSLDYFCVPRHYEPYLENVLVSSGMISDRIERLARDIVNDLNMFSSEDEVPLVCLCVLKGGYKFFSDLVDSIKALNRNSGKSLPFFVDFIRMKSYENDKSTGKVTLSYVDGLDFLRGKNVLVVEDIVDTGRTIERLLKELEIYKPNNLLVVSLLVKRDLSTFMPHYVAFDIPNVFVVGYALDYNEHFRDLNHLCVINQAGIDKFKQEKKPVDNGATA